MHIVVPVCWLSCLLMAVIMCSLLSESDPMTWLLVAAHGVMCCIIGCVQMSCGRDQLKAECRGLLPNCQFNS